MLFGRSFQSVISVGTFRPVLLAGPFARSFRPVLSVDVLPSVRSDSPSVYLSICLFAYLSIYLSIYLFIYLPGVYLLLGFSIGPFDRDPIPSGLRIAPSFDHPSFRSESFRLSLDR